MVSRYLLSFRYKIVHRWLNTNHKYNLFFSFRFGIHSKRKKFHPSFTLNENGWWMAWEIICCIMLYIVHLVNAIWKQKAIESLSKTLNYRPLNRNFLLMPTIFFCPLKPLKQRFSSIISKRTMAVHNGTFSLNGLANLSLKSLASCFFFDLKSLLTTTADSSSGLYDLVADLTLFVLLIFLASNNISLILNHFLNAPLLKFN